MSYILEALKKSQQERELGRTPTLDTSGLFVADQEPVPTHHWGLAAVGLAALAVAIALYAVLRDPPPSVTLPADAGAEGSGSLASGTAASATAVPGSGLSGADAVAKVGDRALPQSQVSAGAVGPGASPDSGWAVPPGADAPRPAPLVEPPPPKRLMRPPPALAPAPGDADVAGFEDPDPGDVDPGMDPMIDPQLELDLIRQLEDESAVDDYADPEAPLILDTPPARPAIPDDLVQDIEAFKQQVRREQGVPLTPGRKAQRPAAISGDPTRLRLTAEQRAAVPGYLMTVHVYDANAAKRFVVINTLKYQEGEQTREGIWVEQILPEGAVLSYAGNPFYVPR